MANIFVSYAHSDVERVEPLVSLLESNGCSVWWDRDLQPGNDFEQEIERALADASHVIVALTSHVAKSDWVRAEAAVGQEGGKLIPVLLDNVQVPLSMRALQVADLRNWPKGGKSAANRLLATVSPCTSDRPFVGRGDAMRTLQASFGAASNGNGGVVMLSGEPGIGKTRCAEEFAQKVEDQGTLVLWGRCYEHKGAPAYWPWVQVLRELAEASSDNELRVLLGTNSNQIAALVPEIGERLGISGSEEDEREERFRFFDAISRLLFRAASDIPLVVVLDDIHWADASSLALLEFLATDLYRNSILVVCAYRDVEVTRKSDILGTLGELTRVRGVQRLRLSGLSIEETRELSSAISGTQLPQSIAEAVYKQTDGNPLFVNEVAKVLAEESQAAEGKILEIDVPDGVREAIGRRLDRLSPQCNKLLALAAVIGRDFDLRVICEAYALELEDCIDELDMAVQGHIVQPAGESPASYRFSHALVRETLYEELATLDRLKLHRLAGDSLLRVNSSRTDRILSQLAHHYYESSALGDYEPAIDFVLRAAAHDEKMYAFEEAARYCEQAISILVENGFEDDRRTLDAYWKLSNLLRNLYGWGLERAIQNNKRGLELARRLGEWELFAEFVSNLVETSAWGSQRQNVSLLEEGLEKLPEDDARNRSRLLAHLATALRVSGNAELAVETADAAVSLGRTLQDRQELAPVLRMAIRALRGTATTLDRRLEYGQELNEIAALLKEPLDVCLCYQWHEINLIEAGKIDEFVQVGQRHAECAARYSVEHSVFWADSQRIVLKLLRGDWDDVESDIEATHTRGKRLEQQHAMPEGFGADGLYGTQMFVLNRDLGRIRSMGSMLEKLVSGAKSNLWLPGLMLSCCEAGLLDKANQAFERLAVNGFSEIPRDDMWLTSMVFCAETCAYLRDKTRAGQLYQILEPFKEQTANHQLAACFGPVATYLGLLAQVKDDINLAKQHFDFAIEMNRGMGAWPLLARVELHMARLLTASESNSDQETSQRLLADAEQLATRFGMAGLLSDIEELRNIGTADLPDGLTSRELDVLRLLAIGRSNKDVSRALGISLSTVATHIRSILNKTGCANRTEAAAYAIRLELT